MSEPTRAGKPGPRPAASLRDFTARRGHWLALPAGALLALAFAPAGAWPLAFLTAWHMLAVRAALRPGETVLVHAAGSGVGSAAIQIAKLLTKTGVNRARRS